MKYLGLSFIVPSAVAVGYFLGTWLDRIFGTHFLYIVFLILGAAGGLMSMVREINKTNP